MNEKFTLQSKVDNSNIKDIIQSAGIEYPHESLGFFRTVYASLAGDANLNGVRLAKSVAKDVSQLVGCQVNFEHARRNQICGSILYAYINKNEEIEVVFSFYKSVYDVEYERALELLEKGDLTVSFELMVFSEDVDKLPDGTKLIKRCNFDGMGLLMDNDPAYPDAVVYEQAKLDSLRELDLVFAKKLKTPPIQQFEGKHWSAKYTNVLPDSSFAVIEPAYLEGKTEDKRCRHLPYKDVKGDVSDVHFRFALSQVDKLTPITDSITIEALREKAQEALETVEITFQSSNKEDSQVDKKANDAILAEFKKTIVAEFGEEAVKDWTEEDFQNEEKIQALRESLKVEETEAEVASEEPVVEEEKVEEAKEEVAEVVEEEPKIEEVEAQTVVKETVETTYEDDGSEKIESEVIVEQNGEQTFKENVSVTRVYSAEEVEAIKAEYEAKIEEVKASAKKIAELRVELGNYASELSDEDLLNEDKVTIARLKKENYSLKVTKEVVVEAKVEEVVVAKEEPIADEVLETGHALVEDDDNVDVKAYIRAKYKKITK